MANTLTNLLPSMYAALNVVSRERIGIIPAVTRDGGVARAAIGQTVYSPVVPANTSYTITPAVDEPDTGDQTVGNVPITISNSVGYPIRFNGEETLGLMNGGTYSDIVQQNFEQAFRSLGNDIEADLAALADKASRAVGTAGTAPFGTADDLTDLSFARRELAQNGAPAGRMRAVLSLDASANLLGKQPTSWRANEAFGQNDSARLDGNMGRLQGFLIGESGQMIAHTKGTGASYLVNDASAAIGDTVIAADGGTGTILAGDVVTFAGDSNKYVVTSALSGGSFTIAEPGLRTAVADNAAITVAADYTPSLAFSQDAIVLATRLPAQPSGGDKAVDRQIVSDPLSGLRFEVSLYKEYKQNLIEVAIAWGYEMVKPEHAVLILG